MVQELNRFGPGKTIVGLTGIFGSGKSTVAHLFEELGAFTVDADLLAHEALLEGSTIFDELAACFPECVDRDGKRIDRKKIAEIIFTDAVQRKKLEALVHPYVFDRMVEEIAGAEAQVAVAEVPLLFEAGFDRYCSPNVMVKASERVIFERLREKGFEPEAVRARWKAQMPAEEKIKKADIVIDNSGSLNETKRQVKEVWKTRISLSKGVI